MRVWPVRVNPVAEPLLNPELTLSEVGVLAQLPDGDRSAPAIVLVEDHGYPLITAGPVPIECIVRDERDPYIDSELELRYAWGDR